MGRMGWEAVLLDNSAILSLDSVGVTLVQKCTTQSNLIGARGVGTTTTGAIEMLPTFKLRLEPVFKGSKGNIQVILRSCGGTKQILRLMAGSGVRVWCISCGLRG